MATISDFKSRLAFGGARPNQFTVSLMFPAFITTGFNASQEAMFLCKATSLPASSIEDVTVSYRGRPVHFAGERSFAPWRVTIYNESTFNIRNAFEEWHDTIINYGSTNGATMPINYQIDLSVTQLDRNDNPTKSYIFRDAYPVVIGEIGLDFDANNQIETFDVEFVYNYFEPA